MKRYDDEEQARREICTYGELLWQRGLVAGTSGNISVRLDDGAILVTPAGCSLRVLSPGRIVRVERDGTLREQRQKPTSELPLHRAAYDVRPDIHCLIHTHPTHCVAWSKAEKLFPLDTVGAIESLGKTVLTAYEPSGSHALADRCADAFAHGAQNVIMQRHGLSSVAQTLDDAFAQTDLTEQTAHIESLAACRCT